MMCSLSGGLASMGAAVPYAIAAKFAHPDRPVIALVGDGAMQMNNMAELITVAQVLAAAGPTRAGSCCVFNNEDLNQVTWEQRVMEGDPEVRGHPGSAQRPLSPLRRVDRAAGHLLRQPDDVGERVGRGAGCDRPVVLEFKTDPEVPPLPAHITLKQAKNFMTAVVKGDPDEASMIGGTLRQLLGAVLPGESAGPHPPCDGASPRPAIDRESGPSSTAP